MTMTKINSPTAKQVVRAYWTAKTRAERAHAGVVPLFSYRGMSPKAVRSRFYSAARRAKAKTLRLMAEYFGVGEPVTTPSLWTGRYEVSIRSAWPASGLHRELSRDRGEKILKFGRM